MSPEERVAARRFKRSQPDFKARRAQAAAERYRKEPSFRLRKRMASRMWKALARHGGNKARRSWQELVGYSVDDLRRHIERQFLRGMSWENSHLWHIDHILPIAGFGPMQPGDETFLACWALTNLRPLWKSKNIAKGSKREHLL
jgi:hypothetical protein